MSVIYTQPLTADTFAPFGDVIECSGAPDKMINQGLCARYNDKAKIDLADGHAGISLFRSETRALPYSLDMMERHPLGSQAFIPMSHDPFLVITAKDQGGAPAQPLAFVTTPGQGINFHRNIWHGVLTPLHAPGLFAVIDRIADDADPSANLEEYWFDTKILIQEGT